MKPGKYNYSYGNEPYWIGPWVHTNWTRTAAGVWSPAPTAGSDTIVNGTFALDASWDKGAGWSIGSGVATCNTAVSSSLSNSGGANGVVNTWYLLTADITIRTAGGGFFLAPSSAGGDLTGSYKTSGTKSLIVRCSSTTKPSIYGSASGGGIDGDVDNFTCKPLSNIFAIRNFGQQVAIAANLTMTANLPGGIVVRYSDANNYIICWHTGGNLRLDAVINGAISSKINTAAVYGPARTIAVQWVDADTIQALYNGVQVGTNQDVSAVPAGNWAGLFGTDTSVQLSSVVWS